MQIKEQETPTFDPTRYKAGQKEAWNRVAAGWQQWWPLFEQGAAPLSERLVSLAELQPGQQVLDVATGVGEPALTAVRKITPSGQVTAIDQCGQMLAIAQERARNQGASSVNFLEMDAETVTLPENSFDAILCRWGLMFLPNLAAALRQMHGLLRENGRIATAVWDVPSKVPMLSLPMRVLRQHVQLPPPPAGVPNPFSLADVAAFEARLRQAGFVHVRSERITLTWEFASAAEFVAMTRDLAAPVNALMAHEPAGRQAEIWAAIGEAAQAFEVENGRLAVPSTAISVVGQRR